MFKKFIKKQSYAENESVVDIEQNLENQKYYSDEGFWDKAKQYGKTAGKKVFEPALKMYYAAKDEDTPMWAKSVVYGALGYLILPIDAIPDITPVVGYTDDFATLTAALTAIAAHIKEEHTERAKDILKQWFDK